MYYNVMYMQLNFHFYTAIPTPPRNLTVQPSQTSLLIEWLEPEQVYGLFDAYYVVCGTQTRPRVSSRHIYSITQTAVNITGLSVFTNNGILSARK